MNILRIRLLVLSMSLAVLAGACEHSADIAATDGSPVSAPPPVEPASSASGPSSEPAPSVSVLPPEPVQEAGFGYQWRRLVSGPGGWVTGLVTHPTAAGVMYARTDVGGAYRWMAESRTWRQMLLSTTVPDASAERDDYQVESIAVSPSDPQVVYLSVGGDEEPAPGEPLPRSGRVLRSSDGGASWVASGQSFFVSGNGSYRQRSERLAVDPANPDRVLLGTRKEGLWVSEDGGGSWTAVEPAQLPTGADGGGITFVSFDGAGDSAGGRTNRVYAGVAGHGVYSSDDGGSSWRQIAPAEPSVVPQEGVVVAGRLYVAFNSPDQVVKGPLLVFDGAQWKDISPFGYSEYEWAIAVDPTNPARMVVVTDAARYGSVFYSTDAGGTWGEMKIETSSDQAPWVATFTDGSYMPVGRLAFDPASPGELWFAEGSGVWRTAVEWPDDHATGTLHWELESNGIEELVAADLIVPPGLPPISGVADFQGFRHDDLAVAPASLLVDARFAAGTDLDYSGSHPDSLVWIGADYAPYYDRDPRAAVSSDGGRTWAELPNLTQEMFGGNVAVSATDPANIVWLPSYFLSPFEHLDYPKGVFVTKDSGASWTHLTSVNGSNSFHRLLWWFNRQALASDKVDGGVFYLLDETEQFLVSADGGTEWTSSAYAPPCRTDNSCFVYGQLRPSPVKAGEVWAGLGDGGLYRSRDRGATPWERVPGIDEVRALGFGAAPAGGQVPAVYLYGRGQGDDQLGLWRSLDDGQSWDLIGRFPHLIYKSVNVVSGDMNRPGRVYIGFGGVGFVYGDDPSMS